MREGDITSREAATWALGQAKYLTPGEHHVLLYLTICAFYQEDNPERAEVGQVMRSRAFIDDIALGTALSVRTVFRYLNQLQDKAYIQREARSIAGKHSSNTIYVLWEHDDLRDKIRAGIAAVPKEIARKPPVAKPARNGLAAVIEMPRQRSQT